MPEGTLLAARQQAAAALRNANIDTAALDSEILLSHALACTQLELLVRPRDSEMTPAQAEQYAALVARRARGEPVAYLTGVREFWSLPFQVGPGVLVPRADSETLMEAACVHARTHEVRTVLDLGTGPGTLLLSALTEFGKATGLGVDCSLAALDYAQRNAADLGLTARAQFAQGHWATGIDQRFDLIFCNPPYIPAGTPLMRDVADFEPALALYGGADGLAAFRTVIPQLPACLAAGGAALLEFGPGQAVDIARMAQMQNMRCAIELDLAGRSRCAVLTCS